MSSVDQSSEQSAAAIPPPPPAPDYEWGSVDASEFTKAHPDDQETLIPSVPGLYVWTYNVTRLLGGGNVLEASRRIDNLLKIVGRNQQRKVGPYSLVTIRDERKAINLGRREILHERFAANDEFGQWIAGLAVHVQRPLYVGKADRLKPRILEHLNGKTSLRKYVMDRKDAGGHSEFQANMLDLVITWYAAPSSLWESAGAASDDDEDSREGGGLMEEGAESPGDLSDAQDAPAIHISKELKEWLYAAESLLIRLSMPMLNETQS